MYRRYGIPLPPNSGWCVGILGGQLLLRRGGGGGKRGVCHSHFFLYILSAILSAYFIAFHPPVSPIRAPHIPQY